jgi:hypothetical protein
LQQVLLRACQSPPAVAKRRMKKLNSRLVAPYIARDPAEAYSPTFVVLFREFCEVLVRVAQLKYHAFPNLERRVHKLLNDDILPRAKKGRVKVCLRCAVPCIVAFQARRLVNWTTVGRARRLFGHPVPLYPVPRTNSDACGMFLFIAFLDPVPLCRLNIIYLQ